jgi:hypothetical protein
MYPPLPCKQGRGIDTEEVTHACGPGAWLGHWTRGKEEECEDG